MKAQIYIISILIAAALGGCKYEPTGANVQPVDTPVNNINLVVLDTTSFSLLRGEVKIAVQVTLGGHTIKSIEGYMDDSPIALDTTQPGYITFHSEAYQDGNYTMRLTLYTSTNSGSLADRIGGEAFYMTRYYRVTVFNASITTPTVSGFAFINGELQITWGKYTQLGFKKYVLTKNGSPLATITDVNQLQYSDTNYAGESASYGLITYVGSLSFIGYSMSPSSTIYPAPRFVSATTTTDNKVRLVWNKAVYTKGFQAYRIKRTEDFYNYKIIATIADFNDTSWIDPSPYFGVQSHYTIGVVSKSGFNSVQEGNINAGLIGQTCAYYSTYLKYIPAKRVYFQNWTVYANGPTMVNIGYFTEDSLQLLYKNQFTMPSGTNYYFNTISDSGSCLYSMFNSNGTPNGVVNKINASSLAIEKTTDLWTLMSKNKWNLYAFSVNDNDCLAAFMMSNGSAELSLFDMKANKLIASLTIPFEYDKIRLSADSKFILNGTKLYQVTGNSLALMGDVGYEAEFTPDPQYVIRIRNRLLEIVRCSTLQAVKSIPVAVDAAFMTVDFATSAVGLSHSSTLQYDVYDINTLQKRVTIGAALQRPVYQNGVLYYNGRYIRIL
ncbi:MAG: hypothetical protein EHM64_03055 [Ignavibacteriae bacterium]|nr:MAG: hypothetical protein EHM64_03055 [Ignavibacteriota bacterium]